MTNHNSVVQRTSQSRPAIHTLTPTHVTHDGAVANNIGTSQFSNQTSYFSNHIRTQRAGEHS